jgi:hypothetical protein
LRLRGCPIETKSLRRARALEPLCAWGTANMEEVSRIFAERDAWRTGKAS